MEETIKICFDCGQLNMVLAGGIYGHNCPGKRKPTIYFRPITFETVCKNGNWKYGGNAITTMSDDINFGLEMAVHQYGKTQKEAEDKLIKFLNGNGANEIECIEPPCKHEFVQREYSSQPYGTCISCGKTILS